MTAANVTEVQESAITFTSGANNGLGTANVGTWTYDANTAYSGGNAMYSSTNGDYATIQFTGRALYLVTCMRGPFTTGPGGEFTVTVDGNPLPGKLSCANGSLFTNATGTWFRYLIPIARGLQDGVNHTVVITVVGSGRVTIDSAFVIAGAKGTPAPGNFVTFGDSWTNNTTGASSSLTAFPSRLTGLLAARLGRGINMIVKGVGGDKVYGADNTHLGGMYRCFTDLFPNTPEFVTILFGANDLGGSGGASGADWARNYIFMLQFIEDCLDTSQVKIALGTPGYIAPALLMPSYTRSGASAYGSPADVYREAVSMTHQVASMFPWLRLALIYEAMNYDTSLIYPNSNNDLGNHPNDVGHGVIANEFARVLLGGWV